MAEPAGPRSGLLVDFGGVLTTSVFDAFAAFCDAEGLQRETVRRAFMEDPRARELLFEFELGRLEDDEFERCFGAVLAVERHQGLVGRLFAAMGPDEAMLGAVAAARRGGVHTGLISNSWGTGMAYDRSLFDGVVISAEEGLRKPDPAIYELGAARIGLAPEACVFVDDLRGNLKPARAMGMATVHHVDAEQTIEELEGLLGVTLRS